MTDYLGNSSLASETVHSSKQLTEINGELIQIQFNKLKKGIIACVRRSRGRNDEIIPVICQVEKLFANYKGAEIPEQLRQCLGECAEQKINRAPPVLDPFSFDLQPFKKQRGHQVPGSATPPWEHLVGIRHTGPTSGRGDSP